MGPPRLDKRDTATDINRLDRSKPWLGSLSWVMYMREKPLLSKA